MTQARYHDSELEAVLAKQSLGCRRIQPDQSQPALYNAETEAIEYGLRTLTTRIDAATPGTGMIVRERGGWPALRSMLGALFPAPVTARCSICACV